MGDLNATGLSNRKGSTKTVHSYRITAPGTVAVQTPIVISASPQNPVLVEGQILIDVPDTGTVGIGTTTAGTELVALTTSVGIGFIPDNNVVGKLVTTALTPIYIIEGGTPSGDGRYTVITNSKSLNLSPV